MQSQKRVNIILSCAVVLILACLCLGAILVTGVGVSLSLPFSFQELLQPTDNDGTQVPMEVIPPGESDLPEDLEATIAAIESEVMQIRGLSTTEPVVRTMISTDQLQEIVAQDLFSDYSDADAQQDVLIMAHLGLLPPDFDLKSFYTDLYSEQIAGFYDDETKEVYVVQGTTFDGSEKLTYAHEFTHVLQDQVFKFEDGLGYTEEACEADSEWCAAVQALIEGDATQTEILWFQTYATRADYADLMETFDNFESPVLDGAPAYMAADLQFPYQEGLVFVEQLYEEGGFDAVNDAFRNLPLSTEQIMHPERYPQDVPITIAMPDLLLTLGGDWRLIDENVMGEWTTFLILNKAYEESQRIPEELAAHAAAGWGGDRYAFYQHQGTGEIIFVLDTLWDTVADAEEFSEAFSQYADLRWNRAADPILNQPTWSEAQNRVVLLREGDRTLWVSAPTDQLVESVLFALQ